MGSASVDEYRARGTPLANVPPSRGEFTYGLYLDHKLIGFMTRQSHVPEIAQNFRNNRITKFEMSGTYRVILLQTPPGLNTRLGSS